MRNITIIFLLIIAGTIKSYSQSTYIAVPDTRAVNDSVSMFKRKVTYEFKTRTAVGVPGVGDYSGMLTMAPWIDNTGGKVHQMNFNDGGIFYRTGTYLPNQWDTWRKFIVEDANGNVSIGTTDPKGYKLAVAGNMIAESMKVKLQGTWPDYVFKKDYQLLTLEQTEKHIKEKGHLPGIPSEAEVKAEGIEVGDMNAKLLRKIEELTLYLIDQNKRLEQQEKKIKELSGKHDNHEK